MNRLPLRIWFIVSLTLALIAIIASLVYRATITTSAGSMVVISLLILAILGTYALLLYLTVRPSLKKLKSLPVVIVVTLVATGAITDAVIHFFRFVFSPDPHIPFGVIVAVLLLAAGFVAYLLVLWIVWSVWRAGKKTSSKSG
jgi:hypothetical protein